MENIFVVENGTVTPAVQITTSDLTTDTMQYDWLIVRAPTADKALRYVELWAQATAWAGNSNMHKRHASVQAWMETHPSTPLTAILSDPKALKAVTHSWMR